MCNYTDDNTLHPYSKDFHQVQKYLKKDCEMIENWFYVNRMYVNPNKCEIMNFGKTNGNDWTLKSCYQETACHYDR